LDGVKTKIIFVLRQVEQSMVVSPRPPRIVISQVMPITVSI